MRSRSSRLGRPVAGRSCYIGRSLSGANGHRRRGAIPIHLLMRNCITASANASSLSASQISSPVKNGSSGRRPTSISKCTMVCYRSSISPRCFPNPILSFPRPVLRRYWRRRSERKASRSTAAANRREPCRARGSMRRICRLIRTIPAIVMWTIIRAKSRSALARR